MWTYGHIVTGDLNIVQNEKLRDLLRKGPTYMETFSWHRKLRDLLRKGPKYREAFSWH